MFLLMEDELEGLETTDSDPTPEFTETTYKLKEENDHFE